MSIIGHAWRRVAAGFAEFIVNSEDNLIYIHIGKCGGVSLWQAIQRSEIVTQKFRHVEKVHVAKPPVRSRSKYLIVIRNPVSRAVSAFNWRYKLVVADKSQPGKPGESEILKKYKTINALAEALYTDDKLNDAVAAEFMSIGHLYENISFYLSELLESLRDDQVFSVLVTEKLDEDVARVLQVGEIDRVHENKSGTAKEKLELSRKGRENLRRFLEPDYAAIEKLAELYPLDERTLKVLRA